MIQLHQESIIKVGGGAAVLSVVLGVLAGIPYLGLLFWPFSCLGYLFIPIGAGLAYGYFAPGKEDLSQGLIGGALTGAVAVAIFSFLSAIFSADILSITGIIAAIFSTTLGAVFGAVFGAIGGFIWPQIQDYVE